MSLYKRKDSKYWWCKLTVAGEATQRSTGQFTKRLAREFEDDLRRKLKDRAENGTRIWQEAAIQWIEDNSLKKSLKRDKDALKWALPHLRNIRLSDIDRNLLDGLRKIKAAETSMATANRTMAVIRSILNAARDDWEWLARAPKVPMYTIQKKDYRWLTHEQFLTLLDHIPKHTQPIAKFAVATGLRLSNITGLKWDKVHFGDRHAYVLGTEAKARKPIPIPLNDYAIAILTAQRGQHPQWVFTYHGERIKQVTTRAWRKAVLAIGEPGFRFHDLRHTWASWHVQSGTPLHVLQKLGGWSSYEMVLRYAHLDRETLAHHSDEFGYVLGCSLDKKPTEGAQVVDLVPERGVEPPTFALRKPRASRGPKKSRA